MVSVSYQVIFNDNYNFKEELKELLKTTFEQNYDEFSEEKIDTYIEITYEKQLKDDKHLIGFEINFSEIGSEINKFIKDFSENLKDSEKINLVLKFYDSDLLTFLSELYKELFKTEMKLREIVSFIFIDTYKSSDDLLKEVEITPKFNGRKDLQKDMNKRKNYLEERYENEFFHILFSDYVNLTKLKDLRNEDFYWIAKISKNFKEFKEKIIERGIRKEEYKTFITDIKQIMSRLEKIRNCIAHNRMLESEDINDYETLLEEINKKIDEFINKIKKK